MAGDTPICHEGSVCILLCIESALETILCVGGPIDALPVDAGDLMN